MSFLDMLVQACRSAVVPTGAAESEICDSCNSACGGERDATVLLRPSDDDVGHVLSHFVARDSCSLNRPATAAGALIARIQAYKAGTSAGHRKHIELPDLGLLRVFSEIVEESKVNGPQGDQYTKECLQLLQEYPEELRLCLAAAALVVARYRLSPEIRDVIVAQFATSAFTLFQELEGLPDGDLLRAGAFERAQAGRPSEGDLRCEERTTTQTSFEVAEEAGIPCLGSPIPAQGMTEVDRVACITWAVLGVVEAHTPPPGTLIEALVHTVGHSLWRAQSVRSSVYLASLAVALRAFVERYPVSVGVKIRELSGTVRVGGKGAGVAVSELFYRASKIRASEKEPSRLEIELAYTAKTLRSVENM